MSDIIHTERGTYDLSTTEGQWKYLCEFLAEKGARGTLWTSLNRLYESALKPDPRDELIKVYEEALKKLSQSGDGTHGSKKASFYDCLPTLQCEFSERKYFALDTLAQGAEIKKKMEEG